MSERTARARRHVRCRRACFEQSRSPSAMSVPPSGSARFVSTSLLCASLARDWPAQDTQRDLERRFNACGSGNCKSGSVLQISTGLRLLTCRTLRNTAAHQEQHAHGLPGQFARDGPGQRRCGSTMPTGSRSHVRERDREMCTQQRDRTIGRTHGARFYPRKVRLSTSKGGDVRGRAAHNRS